MASRYVEASDADLAGQAMPADDTDEDAVDTGIAVSDEADAADVLEQHRSVPSADDDYQR